MNKEFFRGMKEQIEPDEEQVCFYPTVKLIKTA